jgi:hypothetical protein
VDLRERKAMYDGFGDALSRAFELVLTPAIFGFFGWLLDRWLGTAPVFTVVLTLLVFLYVAWRLWTGYETEMQAHERRIVERIGRGRAGAGIEADG